MCGITGAYCLNKKRSINPDSLKAMSMVIAHRGPDDHGYYFNDNFKIGFSHRRLSIIDLNNGKQPMANISETIWITYNGEIYNFKELKKELILKGYQFKTKSDTEVIIYLYEEYGIKAFHRLNGIFSFAIYDKSKNLLVLARDQFGIKPLYYYYDNDYLIFGSEIKSILANPNYKKLFDYNSFNSFLTFRYNPSPQTLFKGIHKLIPGNFLTASINGEINTNSYVDYRPSSNQGISEDEAIHEYQRLLQNAINRQMISDVPVGVLLSGGIDSAIITCLMNAKSKEKIKTFSIGFEGKGDFNELDDAKETAALFGTDHYSIIMNKNDYLDFFFKSFQFLEEPIAESTIPALFHVSKLASNYLKVVLAGQGADEPLGGYHRYLGEKYINKFGLLFKVLPLNIINKIFSRNEKLKRAIYTSNFSDELDRFLRLYTIFTPKQKDLLLNEDSKKNIEDVNRSLINRLYYEAEDLHDSLSKLFYIDTRLSLSDNLLLFGDKITMANSIEMRVPFLDIELVRFLESLPSHFKLKGMTQKYLHKKAVKKWLPDRIVYRKKRGFQTPMDNWLQNDLSSFVKDYLCSNKSMTANFFNLNEIERMIDCHISKKENYTRNLFTLLSFEVWSREFFN